MERSATRHAVRAPRTPRALWAACALVLFALAAPGDAAAQQEIYTWSAGLLGSIGGSLDADPGDEIDNLGYQLNLSMVTTPGTHLVLRAGQLGLDSDDRFENLLDAELSYVTLGGEYRYPHSYYDSGVYLALGGYNLDGDAIFGEDDESAIGLALGATGDFGITPWLSVVAEVSGHYVDFDAAQIFVMGNVGLAVHW